MHNQEKSITFAVENVRKTDDLRVMIVRKTDKIIDEHYQKTGKALLLTGARQVGKTFSVRHLAERKGWQLVEMNFLLQPETIDIVRGAKDVQDLLLRISAYAKRPLVKGKTLLFFDEVEEYPDVITWVKAIVENGSYPLILSGSLLGVELKNIRSIPVGYMDELQMFPCDFEEFIQAVGIQKNIIDHLRESWEEGTKVDDYIHQKMMSLINLYLLVGGMPAAVQTYLDTNDMQRVIEVQKSILSQYKMDIARYDANEKLYINEIFDLIPPELNAKNKRFILKNLNEHFKFSRHENSFTWLRDADMALPTYNANEPRVPLLLSRCSNLFKLFQNDVGLLASQYAEGIQLRILQGETTINFGAIYENLVAQELHAHGWNLYYYSNKTQGEIDFLLEHDAQVIPLEVKSGKNYTRHVALDNLLKNKDYNILRAIVLCNDNVKVVNKVIYAPIYMLMFIKKQAKATSLIYSPDLSGLI